MSDSQLTDLAKTMCANLERVTLIPLKLILVNTRAVQVAQLILSRLRLVTDELGKHIGVRSRTAHITGES
jgi:hypothetical protein